MSTAQYRKSLLTPNMVEVLKRMQAGEKVMYGTSMIDSGRAYFESDGINIKRSTVRGLVMRGLADQNYGYPTGTLTLTKKGREYTT
jgi:hypothetical protein